MTNQKQAASQQGILVPLVGRWSVVSSLVVATGIAAASVFGLVADHPYRGLEHATIVAARAQDVCSVVVAGLLLVLARRTSPQAHLVRLGLLAYVAYSYALYLLGVPMNRIFLVYVVLVLVSSAAFLHGLLRLRPAAWPRVTRSLERGTGWMLVLVAVLFAGLWLSVLLPFAFGGSAPTPRGPGGVAYPVFILDLVIVLPAIGAVGVMLLRGRPVAGPLTAVALVKIVTLFAALWAGVLVRSYRTATRASQPTPYRAWFSSWPARRWSAGGCAHCRPTPAATCDLSCGGRASAQGHGPGDGRPLAGRGLDRAGPSELRRTLPDVAQAALLDVLRQTRSVVGHHEP